MAKQITLYGHGPNTRHNWSPYSDNGGSCVGLAGPGYALIAADTRLSSGYEIMTRDAPKLFHLNEKVILGMAGCRCDVLSFCRLLQVRQKIYSYEHGKQMEPAAAAQFVSNMLYSRRFFPYYVDTILVGLEPDGTGAVYHYDPVGSMEKLKYSTSGSSSSFLYPFLDHKVGEKNLDQSKKRTQDLTVDEAIQLAKDVFISATERDIYCGDGVEIKVIRRDGITKEYFPLRKD